MVINTESRKTFIELELIRNVAEVWDSRNKQLQWFWTMGESDFTLILSPSHITLTKKVAKNG